MSTPEKLIEPKKAKEWFEHRRLLGLPTGCCCTCTKPRKTGEQAKSKVSQLRQVWKLGSLQNADIRGPGRTIQNDR
jgi:hypothetical protein